MQILRRSCVNWRERNRRVIVAIARIKGYTRGSLLFRPRALFFFAPASYSNNNNPVAFHLRFRRTLFNILPELFAWRGFTIHTQAMATTAAPSGELRVN